MNEHKKWEISPKEYRQIEGIAYLTYVKSFEGIAYEDLLQEGLLAYAIAKTKYNPSKNDYFMGFAYKRIKGRMLDWIGKQALNGRASIRSAEGDCQDEDLYRTQYILNEEETLDETLTIEKQSEYEEYKELVSLYVDNFITDYEFYILYKILVENTYYNALTEELNLSVPKIKNIIFTHIKNIKEFIEHRSIGGIPYEELVSK